MAGGVYISYRREDSAGFARLIYDRLTTRLEPYKVFFDFASIQPGQDFVEVLTSRVRACDALVAILGKNWVSSVDENNRRRLDDPHDFVRIEIEAALNSNIRVIPVLVDGATMPKYEDLPDGLQRLTRRQGIQISHGSFAADVKRLTDALALLEEERRKHEALQAPRAADNLTETRGD